MEELERLVEGSEPNDRDDSDEGAGLNDRAESDADYNNSSDIVKLAWNAAAKNSKRKSPKVQKTSVWWKYYNILGKSCAQCKHCLKSFSFHPSTASNLKRHILGKHPYILDAPEHKKLTLVSKAKESKSKGMQLHMARREKKLQSEKAKAELSKLKIPQKGEVLPQRKTPKKRSNIWEHFSKVGDNDLFAQCNLCKQMLAYRCCISNLRRHRASKHPECLNDGNQDAEKNGKTTDGRPQIVHVIPPSDQNGCDFEQMVTDNLDHTTVINAVNENGEQFQVIAEGADNQANFLMSEIETAVSAMTQDGTSPVTFAVIPEGTEDHTNAIRNMRKCRVSLQSIDLNTNEDSTICNPEQSTVSENTTEGQDQNATTTASSKRKKGKERFSYVWNYFTLVGEGTAECNTCHEKLRSTSLSNLTRHFTHKHREIYMDKSKLSGSPYAKKNLLPYKLRKPKGKMSWTGILKAPPGAIIPDNMWQVFTKIDSSVASCNSCHENLVYRWSASTLRRHWIRKHPYELRGDMPITIKPPPENVRDVLSAECSNANAEYSDSGADYGFADDSYSDGEEISNKRNGAQRTPMTGTTHRQGRQHNAVFAAQQKTLQAPKDQNSLVEHQLPIAVDSVTLPEIYFQDTEGNHIRLHVSEERDDSAATPRVVPPQQARMVPSSLDERFVGALEEGNHVLKSIQKSLELQGEAILKLLSHLEKPGKETPETPLLTD